MERQDAERGAGIAAVPAMPEPKVARRDLLPGADKMQMPRQAVLVRVLGVDYAHLRTPDGGDLYLTRHGVPYQEWLMPENWHESEWFERHRQRLEGTAVVYKVPTKPVAGESIALVVKYSRVGQDVPLATHIIYKVLNAEFNSPFEEFSLVEEMRLSTHGPADLAIHPKLPLAIYVPPERMQLWQMGRSEWKIASKIQQHPGVEIDILRDYIMVYGWIHGVDAVEAHGMGLLNTPQLESLTTRVTEEMQAKGFRMLDMKPRHIVVFPKAGGGFEGEDGRVRYRVLDFELLQRTPEYDAVVKSRFRGQYLVLQRDRFAPEDVEFPEHLRPTRVLGTEYVYGHAESTGGHLWVVGRDPRLFDYFLPERWRKTPRLQLSDYNQIYYTLSKDNIHLVWRVSRVGEEPVLRQGQRNAEQVLRHGYNSPFEAVSYALELQRRGVPTTNPRAIYMTGHRLSEAAPVRDPRRFESHRGLLTPFGEPVLREGYDYITLWGFWNGTDAMLADFDGAHFKCLNLRQAVRHELLDAAEAAEAVERYEALLRAAGFEALALGPGHLLISVEPGGLLRRDASGRVETRLCNMQFVRPLE